MKTKEISSEELLSKLQTTFLPLQYQNYLNPKLFWKCYLVIFFFSSLYIIQMTEISLLAKIPPLIFEILSLRNQVAPVWESLV